MHNINIIVCASCFIEGFEWAKCGVKKWRKHLYTSVHEKILFFVYIIHVHEYNVAEISIMYTDKTSKVVIEHCFADGP